MELLDRFRACLLGLAVGDALGTRVEFMPRGSFPPVTDMLGGGPFQLEPGQFTDDTSMALCLAESLVICKGFDARDQMERYQRWYTQGYWSSTGKCFDIGSTVRSALVRFSHSGESYCGSTDPFSAGNGSLMRLAPIPIFYYPQREKALHYAVESSRTTHAAQECLDACRLFAALLLRTFSGVEKEGLLLAEAHLELPSKAIQAIARGEYMQKDENQIKSSGYVVHSLEAALWCFWNGSSFEEAVLKAVNLGEDADTTAAICGQIAGAYYGLAGIPAHWLKCLTMGAEIDMLAQQLRQVHQGE